MKHLKKFNEDIDHPRSFDEKDVEFFNSVFAEFLDQEDVECEHSDGTWKISIPIPYIDIRRIVTTKEIKDRSIKDYIEAVSKVDNILKDIEVCINRVKDEYGDSILIYVTHNFCVLKIIIERMGIIVT